ncbi:MAG: crossover junction endodeoxyribonuclease RuvC [Chthonomonadales bacterium]|nr:crossover junction endodeoxyribonuclease RuvC [Chthonomonadales bacterium]
MIILGVDPGTATTGYGLLARDGQRVAAVGYGVVRTSSRDLPPVRLMRIYERLCDLMDAHAPDVLVTERLFFGTNETTAIAVGRTIGVILLAAAQRGLPWVEYSPPVVKQAVVGYGGAEKRQVQYMIRQILGLSEIPRPDDAADALAVAICHAHTMPPERHSAHRTGAPVRAPEEGKR